MKNSATYWVGKIKLLTLSLKECQPYEKSDYEKALRFAVKKLTALRRKAGIYLN